MATKPAPDTVDQESADKEARPKKSYTPEGYKDVKEFLDEALEKHKADREADRHNTEAALDDLKFVSCDIDGMGQWDSQVLADRDQLGQPSVTNNFLPMIIGQVVGDRRQNQTSIKVLPREDGDVNVAEIRSDLIRNIEVQSRAPRVYSQAFEHAVTCGIGNIRVELDWTDDDVFDRDIFIRLIPNPLSVTWDYMSIDPTGRDAEHCFVEDLMPRKQYDKLYPDTPAGDFGEDVGDSGWLTEDTVRVTEYWRMVQRKRTIALMNDGKVIDITDKDPAEYVQELFVDELGEPRIREVNCKYAQMHLISSFAILEGPYELKINRLPIIRCSGREIPVGDKRVRFGIIRFIKENQRLDNFWDSTKAEILSKAPRQQWIGPADAFAGYEEKFRLAHISGDPIVPYNPKASTPPQRMEPVQYPTAFATESALQKQRMKDGSGIHDASLGIKSNETSGVAIRARQAEGDVATVIYHDHADAMIEEAGDITNQLIGQVYDIPRTIRIVGQDQEERLQRINDPMDPKSVDLAKGKYDTTITTGPTFQTRRVESAQSIGEFIRYMPEMAAAVAHKLPKAMDWPDADEIAEDIRKFMIQRGMLADENDEMEGGQPDPAKMAAMQQQQQAMQMQQMAMQAQQVQLQAGVSKAQSEAKEAEANALKAQADAKKAAIEAQVAEINAAAGIGSHLNSFSDAGQSEPARQPQSGKRDPARQPGRQRGRK